MSEEEPVSLFELSDLPESPPLETLETPAESASASGGAVLPEPIDPLPAPPSAGAVQPLPSEALPDSQPMPAMPVEPPLPQLETPPVLLAAPLPESTVSPVVSASPSASPRKSLPSFPVWILLLLMLGCIIVLVLGLAALLSRFSARPVSDAEPLSISKLSTFLSPPIIPADQYILQQNGSPLHSATPALLTIDDVDYPVVAVIPEAGRWPMPADKDTAVWVYGTVINYVIGLPHTEYTAARLAGLDSSARFTMALSSGVTLVFGSPESRRVSSSATAEVMAQQRPGLTLVLLSDTGDNRLVVQARYLPEESVAEGAAQNLTGLNVEVEDFWDSEDPEDSQNLQFFIEFSVTNTGATEINPALFNMILEDGNGQQWSESRGVSEDGDYGPLLYALAPGESADVSVGYLVPKDLKLPLTWIFRADPTVPQNMARFPIPYEPAQPEPAQPQVSLADAFADSTRDVIVVNGELRNVGEQPLYVTLSDVQLTSSRGETELRASTPLLPWTINPGGTQRFELQFSWPDDVDTVLINILGFTFELGGLP